MRVIEYWLGWESMAIGIVNWGLRSGKKKLKKLAMFFIIKSFFLAFCFEKST